MRLSHIVIVSLLLIAASPLVDAKGNPDAPGLAKKKAPVEAPPAPPEPQQPTRDPYWDALQMSARAPEPREAPDVDLFAEASSVGSTPRSYGSASVAPLVTVSGGGAGGWPAWTWLLPALGLVSVGATALLARRAPREPLVRVAPIARAPPVASASVPSLLLAGKAALENGQTEEAITCFTRAIRLDPNLAVAHFSRGVCLASIGRHDEAYRALRRAHALDPLEGAYRLELARAAARIGRHAEAMPLLATLVEALPELADDAVDDDAFASLRDHPRFLAIVGRL